MAAIHWQALGNEVQNARKNRRVKRTVALAKAYRTFHSTSNARTTWACPALAVASGTSASLRPGIFRSSGGNETQQLAKGNLTVGFLIQLVEKDPEVIVAV